MRKAVLCGLAVASIAPVAPAELRPGESPLVVSDFVLERQRKDISGATGLVRASFKLAAAPGLTLSDLRVKVDYVDYRGEAMGQPKRSMQLVGTLAARPAKAVVLESIFVPVFHGYVLTFTGSLDGKRDTWQFYGAAGAPEPWLLPSKPVPGLAQLMCMATELEQSSRSNAAVLYIRVRNVGAEKVTGASLDLVVRGEKGRKLGELTKKLLTGAPGGRDGVVNGGEERLFALRFRSFPPYESYGTMLTWDQASGAPAALGGGEFRGVEDVELAKFHFGRDEPEKGRLTVAFKVRNGLASPVSEVRVTVNLVATSAKGAKQVASLTFRLDRTLEPGQIDAFSEVVAAPGAFDDFDYDIAYRAALALEGRGAGGETAQPQEPPSGAGEPAAPPADAAPHSGARAADAPPAGEPAKAEGGAEVAPLAHERGVEVRVTEAKRTSQGVAIVSAQVVNTGKAPVANVVVTLILTFRAGGMDLEAKRAQYPVPGTIPAGGHATFRLALPGCPRYDKVGYEVTFAPAGR